MEIPQQHFGMLKSRSGLALKNNIHVHAGIIDADYRGEIKVLLSNQSHEEFTVHPGMRIGQLIIFKLPDFVENMFLRVGRKHIPHRTMF